MYIYIHTYYKYIIICIYIYIIIYILYSGYQIWLAGNSPGNRSMIFPAIKPQFFVENRGVPKIKTSAPPAQRPAPVLGRGPWRHVRDRPCEPNRLETGKNWEIIGDITGI